MTKPAKNSIRSRLSADESGNSALEFAIVLPLLMAAIFGIVEFSRLAYVNHSIHYIAWETTRYASVRGSSWAGTPCVDATTLDCAATVPDLNRYASSLAVGGVSTSDMQIVSTWPGTTAAGDFCAESNGPNSPGCLVSVVISYTFSIGLPFLPKLSIPLSSTAIDTVIQ